MFFSGQTQDTVGGANTPPFFSHRFEPVARATLLYLTDETTLRCMLGAAWLTNALRIHVAKLKKNKQTQLKTAEGTGGLSLARVTPGHCQKKYLKKGPPSYRSIGLWRRKQKTTSR